MLRLFLSPLYFNPRSPHGERPYNWSWNNRSAIFQSTLPARGATPNSCYSVRAFPISIHAPRTGSDFSKNRLFIRPPKFQSTLPARGATKYRFACVFPPLFQSTLPARGATARLPELHVYASFQSTLPARGATGYMDSVITLYLHFNPRSPHGERPKANTCGII